MTPSNLPKKKLNLQLVGLDGNAFSLLGAFSRQAKRERWSAEEIEAVRQEATSKDYDHLLSTLLAFTHSPEGNSSPQSPAEPEGPDL
jgi:hypothetical protein